MSDLIKILLQAEIDPKSINNIKSQVNDIKIKVKADVDPKTNTQFKDLNAELQKLGNFDLSKTPLVEGWEIVGYSTKEAKDGTVKFTQSLNDGKNKIVTYSGEVNKASNSYEILGKSTKQATRENQTFIKELGIAIKRTVEWSLAVGGYYKVIREFQNGIKFINEADKSLNSIQMITGMTVEETSKLAVEYSDLGRQMGITTKEILDGSVEWFRQGKTVAETADLMKASIMEARLAGIDTAQATEYLTSTLNGFQLEANQAIDVVSKMVAIDNVAATSVAELSEALQRSATSAQQAGVEIDTLLAYVGTVSSVTRRSASSIGESFKTLFARMQDIKQGKLDEEGLGLSDVETALNRVGIAVRSSETDFRDLDDVISDISRNWKSYDEVTQSSIAKAVAGTRQRENFLVLMNNYQTALNLEAESLNSAGLAQERYAIYLESTEAKLAQLEATKNKLFLNMIDSKLIKDGIDLLISLTGGVDQLANHSQILAVALGVLAIAFIRTYKAMKGMNMADYIAKYAAMTTSTNLLTVAQTGLAGAIGMVKTAFMFLFTTPLGWITLAIGGVLALTNHLRKQREEVEKLTTTYNDYSNSLATMDIEGQKKSLNEITALQEKLNKLIEERDKANNSLTPNSHNKATSKDNEINDLIEQIKSLGFEVDETTGKIQDLDTIVNNIKIDEKINTLSKLLDRQVSENENLQALINNYQTLSQVENKNQQQKESMTGIIKELEKKYEDLIIVVDEEGNMQIKNIGILEDKKIALQQEKDALITSAKDKITALVNETTVVFNNTKTTIGAIKDRIAAYNAEIEVINRRNRAAAGTYSETKMLESEDRAFKMHRRNNITGAVDYVATYVDPLIDNLFAKYNSGGGSYIPPSTNGKSSSGSSSSSKSATDSRNFLESIDAEIRAIKIRNDGLIKTADLLKEQMDAIDTDTVDGLNEKYELTGKLIEHNNEIIKSFKEEQDAVHQRANQIREQYSQYNIDSWFDASAEQTTAYIEQYNKATKDQQEEMDKVFGQVQQLKKAWMDSNSEIKNTNGSIKELTLSQTELNAKIDEMLQKQYEADVAKWIKEQNDLYDKQQERLQALEQIQEQIVAIIRKRGEEEKKALDEAHQNEMDSLEERHKTRMQGYKDELDEFNKMIQAKIDALDEQYEEEDYLEQLNKEREEANRLQAEIDVLSLDDSLTARNKTIELRKQLADQNEKIAKMQQKKERDTLKKSLEDQLKDKEKQTKDIEKIADNTYNNEKKRLEEDYRINKEYLEKKYSDEQVYAEAREAIMRGEVEVAEGVFMDIYDAFEDFEDKFGKGMGILGDIIKNDFINQLKLAQDAIDEMDYKASNLRQKYDSDYVPKESEVAKPKRPSKEDSTSSGGKIYMSSSDFNKYVEYKRIWEEANKVGNTTAKKAATNAAQSLREKYEIASDKYSYDDLKNRSYKDVGFVNGGKITKTGTLIAPFHGRQDSPEWIFNDEQLKKIIQEVSISSFKMAIPKIPNISGGRGSSFQIDHLIHIEGNVDEKVLPKLQKAGNDIAETIKNLNKGGVFRPVKI